VEERILRRHGEIADFLASTPPANRIEREKMMGFVRWYSAHGFLFILRERGVICGVAAVRPVSSIEEGKTHWAFTLDGEILWIDFIAGRKRIPELYLWIVPRWFPKTRMFAGTVERENDRLRVIPSGRIAKFVQTLKKQKEENNGKQ
jgi:hypothetical protein